MPIIALTTDFGTRDHYVGAIKGVIAGLSHKTNIIDITHDIQPYNIMHGAFVLHSIWPYFPEGTIHLAVVDPGVGSPRRIIMGRYAGQYIIAPDNGLITLLHRKMRIEEMRVVENRCYFLPRVSSTFQGRDIFAPVAAHLANGVKTHEFGKPTDRVEILDIPYRSETIGRRIMGRVLYVDRFGNLVTNINRQDLLALGTKEHDAEVLVNDENIGTIRMFFDEVPPGKPLAIVGSTENLEIAVNRGNAADRFTQTTKLPVAKGKPPTDAIRVEVR